MMTGNADERPAIAARPAPISSLYCDAQSRLDFLWTWLQSFDARFRRCVLHHRIMNFDPALMIDGDRLTDGLRWFVAAASVRLRRMSAAVTQEELHGIRGWLLAVLRFAITREQADRAA